MQKTFYSISIFYLIVFYTPAYSLTCTELIKRQDQSFFSTTALASLAGLESSNLNFPKIRKALAYDDISNLINEFMKFAQALRSNSLNYEGVSAKFLYDGSTKIEAEIIRTEAAISILDTTEHNLRRIVLMNNVIKGHYFEARVGFLLNESGFDNIEIGPRAFDLVKFVQAPKLSKKYIPDLGYVSARKNTELDFIATKDEINYLIEVKSVIPVGNDYLSKILENASKQMKVRDSMLSALGMRSRWKTVLIFEYQMDRILLPSFFGEGVVDHVMGLKTFHSTPRLD